MTTLLHISDLHFGRPFREHLGNALHALAGELQPDGILCTGDLVQWAESASAWQKARDYLNLFNIPIHITPGNHDIPRPNLLKRFRNTFGDFRAHLGRYSHPIAQIGNAFIVDAVTPHPWTASVGYLSQEQLDDIRARLANAPADSLRIISMHHPLRRVGLQFPRAHLRGAKRARKAFAAMGAELVVSGHNHFPHVEAFGEDAQRVVWAQAGTATSTRYRFRRLKKSAVSVIRIAADAFTIEWWTCGANERQFALVRQQHFPRRSAES